MTTLDLQPSIYRAGADAEFGRWGLHGDPGVSPGGGCVGAEPLHVGNISELKASRTLYYAFPIIVGLPLLQQFKWGDWEKEGRVIRLVMVAK